MTDLLVAGYIRNRMREYKIEIPQEIIGVFFLFWFIPSCDQWDRSLIDDGVKINGPFATMTASTCCTLFGSHIVHHGKFEWKIRFNSEIKWITIGVIKDKPEILRANRNTNNFGFKDQGGCLVHGSTGNFFCSASSSRIYNRSYATPFSEKGTVIEITLNMNRSSIGFKINGKDYGKATSQLQSGKYRLAISISNKRNQIELL